ncbi:leucine-rich repeat domain-containing protein [Fusobacterium ulcerans]
MIYSWQELLDNEWIHVDDGTVTTNYNINNDYKNASSDYLVGKLVIPDNVTTMEKEAFYKCLNLTSVKIPSSVTSIEQSAFKYCEKLTSIEIPDSVTTIGKYTFGSCKNLETINYTGTEEQWNFIEKGTSWNYDTPSTLKINYNYKK